jgi:glycosyltransferase involved in cell wall biosynthesis
MPRLSIVVPIYFNEPNIPDTVPQLLALRDRLPGYELELVFVDDGSGDRSLELLLEWRARHPDVIQVLELSRNFGSMSAILAGLGTVTGDCVGMIAADLQDPPELFIDMVRHWSNGSKVVLAVRADREESRSQKFFSNGYYALMRRFALPDYPEGGFDFFLVDRQVVGEVVRISEKNTNLMSLIFWLGFSPVMIPYVRSARRKGKSRWTFSKKLKLFVDSFVAFSYAPIRMLSVLGGSVALAAFVYAGYVLAAWFARDIPVKGYAPIVILLAFTAGVQMLMLGILGEYLWRALDETRRRPPFVVSRRWANERMTSSDRSSPSGYQADQGDALTRSAPPVF